MKRITFLLVMLLLIVIASTAFAIEGPKGYYNDDDEAETFVTFGNATFILDEDGKLIGTLKPDETSNILSMQNCQKKSATGIQDGKAIRRKFLARVRLDDNYDIVKGGANIYVTITLTDVDTVESIIDDELTTETIISATEYSPTPAPGVVPAGHMFMTRETGRFEVGYITFNNGNVLTLYAGNWDNDDDLELGIAPVVQSQPEPKDDCHRHRFHCRPHWRPDCREEPERDCDSHDHGCGKKHHSHCEH